MKIIDVYCAWMFEFWYERIADVDVCFTISLVSMYVPYVCTYLCIYYILMYICMYVQGIVSQYCQAPGSDCVRLVR